MRIVHNPQLVFGQVPIEDLVLDARSRDDIPAVLKGIQQLYKNDSLRQQIFDLLQRHLLDNPAADDEQAVPSATNPDPGRGRPGMALWAVLVLALLKQGLRCDFDRLTELANKHSDVRSMLGLSGLASEQYFAHRSVVRNVSLLTPTLLQELNHLVVQEGLRLVGVEEEQPLQARVDSFVVETNVHYPTDVSLLWDALRCLLRVVTAACTDYRLAGWRQSEHWQSKVYKRFQRVRTAGRRQGRKGRRQVRLYLRTARELAGRAEQSQQQLRACGAEVGVLAEIERLLGHTRRQVEQIERRVLQRETIPHGEKVFSIFEEHTRWCAKGKAGRQVELGVPVAVVESEQQFVLHWQVMWDEQDVEVACPLVRATQAQYPQLQVCSFDKGFHSQANRAGLEQMLEVSALPKKGRLSQADQAREGAAEFRAARRAHPAVESAINNLEQRGLNRVLSRGPDGFERMVGLGVLAANVHRIGLVLQRRERERLKATGSRSRYRALALAA